MMGHGWINLTFEGRTHTLPLEDSREHVVNTTECWCDPRVDESFLHCVVVHNAHDEREKFETGERKPS